MIIFDPDLKIFYSDKINDSQYLSGFSTKVLGDGKNIKNIFSFFNLNKIKYKTIIDLIQIHSSNINFFEGVKNNRILEKIEDVDGIVANKDRVVLIVQTADCLPIIFADKVSGLIGISHQGWRGSFNKLAVKMIDKFIAKGAKEENIVAALGPGIGSCCYDIDQDRYFQFLEEFNGYSNKIFHLRGGRRYLNLALLNYLQLINAGIKKENIDFFPFCTSCDKKRFFSYRREGSKDRGDMFSFVMKTGR